MSDKVIQFPWRDRKRNEIGRGYVGTRYSNEWLNFTSSKEYNGNTYFKVNVMKTNEDNSNHEITELIITESDLLRAMKHVKNKK